MNKESLFSQFPPIESKDWKDKIVSDLKGADYDKTLVWRTSEGFDVQPYYRDEDLKDMPHMGTLPGVFPFLRGNNPGNNHWLVRQDIVVNDIKEANGKAQQIKLKGIDSLGFIVDNKIKADKENLELLLKDIRMDVMELNFRVGDPLQLVQTIDRLAKDYNRDLNKVTGSLEYDPLTTFSRCGMFAKGYEEDHSMLLTLHEASAHLPNFQYLTINAALVKEAGAGIVTEMANALALGAHYLTYLTDHGLDIDEVAPRMRFHFGVGSNYFMEIAKFRAIRFLWAKLVNAYGLSHANHAQMHIHASNSMWNKTVYDPYVNMLRTTTESMSAIIGGVQSLTVLPFDAAFEAPTPFAERIARNQQLILKGEAHFDKIADPAAGSYYIEALTHELIGHAWERFLEIDATGGYLEALQQGLIQKQVHEEAAIKDTEINKRKRSILGTNQFPNIHEHIDHYPEAGLYDKESEIITIKPYRGAEAIERLRFSTDLYSQSNNRPRVWMFTYGNLAMRKARSQFAGNFFGCAGYEIIDNNGFASIEEGIRAAREAHPEMVVICSSDEEYATIAEPIFKALNEETIVVLAGNPVAIKDQLVGMGLINFIHVKSNLLEELQRYQQLLGISSKSELE